MRLRFDSAVLGFVLVLLLALGCSDDQPRPAAPSRAHSIAVGALDPAFASADSLIWCAMAAPDLGWTTDVDRRQAFLADALLRFRADEGAVAAAFARADATSEDLEQIVAFLASEPGRRLARAHRATRAGYPMDWPAFLPESLARWSDPERVGESAAREVGEIGEQADSEATASPPLLALAVGAMLLRAEDARALQAFLKTPSGQVWARAREQFDRTAGPRVREIQQAALDAGVLEQVDREKGEPDLPDLILPRAEAADDK